MRRPHDDEDFTGARDSAEPPKPRHDLAGLYPEPGEHSAPPTWADIERLALHYPVVHDAVTLVHVGHWTREQALIAIAYGLAGQFSQLWAAELDRLRRAPATALILDQEGRRRG